ncbi:MAG TPA: hypothetical protein VL418_13820 [Devosiaceae bacterium]|nr:hypothetical protein [Devosiaceae bacterium]
MLKTYLFSGLAVAAITFGAVGTASAQRYSVTCPIGSNGIEYRYVPGQNICVPVRVQAGTEPRVTQQSAPLYGAPALVAPAPAAPTVQTPLSLSGGDGSGNNTQP